MANRTRDKRLVVAVTEEEKTQILLNMERAGIHNLGGYARKMMLNGQVMNADYSAIDKLCEQVGKVGKDIHQIARRLDEAHPPQQAAGNLPQNAYAEDLKKIQKRQEEIWQLLRSVLLKLP